MLKVKILRLLGSYLEYLKNNKHLKNVQFRINAYQRVLEKISKFPKDNILQKDVDQIDLTNAMKTTIKKIIATGKLPKKIPGRVN